jgi:hypothetical protein
MEYFNWLGFTPNTEIDKNVKDLDLLELKMKRSFSSSNIDKEKIRRDVSVSLENNKELKKSMSLSNIQYLEENETIKSFEINNNENMDIKNNDEVHELIKEESLNNSDMWLDKNSSSPDSFDGKHLEEMKNEIISEVTESVSASYEFKIRQIKDKVKFEMKLFEKILESLKTINKNYYYYKGMTLGMTIGLGAGYYFFKK